MTFDFYDEVARIEPDDEADDSSNALREDAFNFCMAPEQKNDKAAAVAPMAQVEQNVDRAGATIARKIARAEGFGQETAIRSMVQEHIRQGGRVQSLVDAANRAFESNRQPYYLGVGERNNLILYTPDGIRTLDVNRRQ